MKPNIWVSSSQASELLAKQLAVWPLAQNNFLALDSMRTKSFDMGGFEIKAQFNPSRIVSTGAKPDAEPAGERKCFLCPENLPVEQLKLPFGDSYMVLCNPYPIFREHFTIPARTHTPQAILPRFGDFLGLIKRLDRHTIFYNGPKSGASIPGHAHFQAVTGNVMPLNYELDEQLEKHGRLACEIKGEGTLYTLTHYLRNGFVIRASTQKAASALFGKLYHALPKAVEETEPGMNVFGRYVDNTWVVVVIPRRCHRPRQFFATGEEQIIVSPGGADTGGLVITPREEDFNKLTAGLLQDIYRQICFGDQEIGEIASRLS